MEEAPRHSIEARLARIEGHVHAVHKMAHEGRSYPEIVHQITAVRASLDAVLQAIVDELVQDCLRSASAKEPIAPTVQQLREVVASAL